MAKHSQLEETVCPRCGLPIGRGSLSGPLWTPEFKGIEVCGCPSEEEQEREKAAQIHHDLDVLEKNLEEMKKEH